MKSQGKTDSKIDTFTEKIKNIFSSCHLVHLCSELLEKSAPTVRKYINVPKRVEQTEAYGNSTAKLLFLEHAWSGVHEFRIQTELFLGSPFIASFMVSPAMTPYKGKDLTIMKTWQF